MPVIKNKYKIIKKSKIIRKQLNKKINIKILSKTTKKNKLIQNYKKSRLKSIVGGGILDSLGSSLGNYVYYTEQNPDYKTSSGFSSIDSKIKKFNALSQRISDVNKLPNILTILYSFGNKQTGNLDSKKIYNITEVEREPRIILGTNDTYLLLLTDNDKFILKRVLWLAKFKNRGLANRLIPYITPTPIGNLTQLFIFKLFKLPNNVKEYIPYDSTGSNRTAEFTKFMEYINNNQLKPFIVKPFNVSKSGKISTDLFSIASNFQTTNQYYKVK